MNPKEAYEMKKKEKDSARENRIKSDKKQEKKGAYLKYIVWIIIILLIGYGLFLLARTAGPEGEDFSVQYADLGRAHIPVGSERPAYNSNPPSSGPHHPQPARGGFYDSQLADETVVHNLEHGDIWIAYHPDISDDALSTLKRFAGQFVVVSPRAENETDIALVAWGRVDAFNIENGEVDRGRIKDFIIRYDNKGPERLRAAQLGHGG